MSIQNEITRIDNAKADIKEAIEGKGVSVPSSAKIDGMAEYIDQISTGGEECYLYAGRTEPTDAEEGDLWVDYSDESGGTPYAIISVTYPAGSTCTCTKGSTVLTAEGTGGKFNFGVPEAGEWTLYCTDGSRTASQNATISVQYEVINLILAYSLYSASLSPASGFTYLTDISGLSSERIKLYSEAISKNSQITNNTSDVYIDDAENNEHYKFSIGTSKVLSISGTNYPFIILGFNHDDLTEPNYYGALTATGKAGISWQMRNCMNNTYKLHNSRTNVNGWRNCNYRVSDIATFFNGFSFKNITAPVNKSTSSGGKSSIINIDSDTLFLLSEIELYGRCTYSFAGEGTQYAWYKAGNTTIKTVQGLASWQWNRSPTNFDTTEYCGIRVAGDAGADYPNVLHGVSLAFCT